MALESCEVEKDITSFIQEKGTGQEIPDPPKYINFCRGDVNDTGSEASEDEAYSVAQFQRTINPAFRSSSPQPSVFESHHDPQSDLAMRNGHLDAQTPPSRETTLTPQKAMGQPAPQIDYRRQAQTQAQLQNIQTEDFAQVPHNEYPTDGMTMFCRTAPVSDRSSAASPMRPGSRDSQSEYSDPTSFSSAEPVSGKQSPTKPVAAAPAMSPTKQVQKKRSGFFSNSPFRRKSKHEKEPPVIAPPDYQNNYGSANGPNAGSNAANPKRNYGQTNAASRSREAHSRSPEPVDPRANFQLNVGNNVFDVASPDSNRKKPYISNMPTPSKDKDLDPIAQALAELKGLGKQSSVRMSADRYSGIATPAPGVASRQNSDVAAAQRGTPPPSYNEAPVKRLDLPQPAFTSAQMKQTTQRYERQTQDMYGSSRPGTRGGGDVPRATSPLPMRSTSPRPGINASQNQGQNGYSRSVSPNPYSGSRQPSSSPTKQGYGNANPGQYSRHNSPGTGTTKAGYNSGRYSRHGSPGDIPRAVSPQPQYSRQERPSSSSSGGGMALQLSNGDPSVNQRARGATNARPMSHYGGQGHDVAMSDPNVRSRSKSVAGGGQFTRDGRPILQYGKSSPQPIMVCEDMLICDG